jgi:hypothetical protein
VEKTSPGPLFLLMTYLQDFGTQQACIPIGDVVSTTHWQICDGAGDGHHRILLVTAAVHLVRHKNMSFFSARSQVRLPWLYWTGYKTGSFSSDVLMLF